ncbi:hypothetical protein NEIRO03_1101 [Nematocida sp. AWRm78]|nr:hypothetical protein NEIRO02_1324 [Nematocida sp. AWRm79]KAI5183511.1 hypothetical protein NEIRO03_1101 [Nematocida sp. AWRm78]
MNINLEPISSIEEIKISDIEEDINIKTDKLFMYRMPSIYTDSTTHNSNNVNFIEYFNIEHITQSFMKMCLSMNCHIGTLSKQDVFFGLFRVAIFNYISLCILSIRPKDCVSAQLNILTKKILGISIMNYCMEIDNAETNNETLILSKTSKDYILNIFKDNALLDRIKYTELVCNEWYTSLIQSSGKAYHPYLKYMMFTVNENLLMSFYVREIIENTLCEFFQYYNEYSSKKTVNLFDKTESGIYKIDYAMDLVMNNLWKIKYYHQFKDEPNNIKFSNYEKGLLYALKTNTSEALDVFSIIREITNDYTDCINYNHIVLNTRIVPKETIFEKSLLELEHMLSNVNTRLVLLIENNTLTKPALEYVIDRVNLYISLLNEIIAHKINQKKKKRVRAIFFITCTFVPGIIISSYMLFRALIIK